MCGPIRKLRCLTYATLFVCSRELGRLPTSSRAFLGQRTNCSSIILLIRFVSFFYSSVFHFPLLKEYSSLVYDIHSLPHTSVIPNSCNYKKGSFIYI